MKPITFVLTIALIASVNFTCTAQNFITNGLVAYYPFDGNANDMAGTNNGIIYGGVTLAPDRFGSNNSAYIFNGVDGYIDIGSPAGNTPTNLTETAWVKIISRDNGPQPVSPPEDLIITKRKSQAPAGEGWAELGLISDGSNAGAPFVAVAADFYNNVCAGDTLSPTNAWLFLCGVCSNGTYQIYLNGHLEKTLVDYTPLNSVVNMYLMHSGAFGTYCNGVLDDVRIYNRALSSNEIALLYYYPNIPAIPAITMQPTNVTANISDTVSFSVTATGIPPLGYQWFKDGTIVQNATNASLTLTNVQPPRIGNYTVTVSDTNGFSIGSIPASLNLSNVDSVLWQGLTAYYPFNGNAMDATGNGNNGIINGGVALAPDRFGSNNSAYVFNGVDGYMDIGNPVGNSPSYLTEAAWVKLITRENTAIPSVNPIDVIITKRQTGGIGSGWATLSIEGTGSNTGAAELNIDDDNYLTRAIGTSKPPTNVWFFVCGVRSNNVYQIYVNGLLENTINDSHFFSSTENMYLMHDGAWGTYCNGVLDDVRIYNRALSPSDVLELYASEAPPVPPHTATATAQWAGSFVVAVTVNDAGAGYTNTPVVHFIGGGGTNAQASVVMIKGVIVAINIVNPGFGYTSTPLVVIDPPFISNPVLGIGSISMLNFTNLFAGTNYQLQQFNSVSWVNQSAAFKATNSFYTTVVSGQVGSGDYRLAQVPLPVQATASAQVINGFVVSASVINAGSGYFSPPAVTIIANVGSNATATASISSGKVTTITITSAGIGYVNPVTIQIDAPAPAATLFPTVVAGVALQSSSLAPYDNYQIQYKADIVDAWGNLSDGLFAPLNPTYTQNIFLTNSAGFFRLQFVQ